MAKVYIVLNHCEVPTGDTVSAESPAEATTIAHSIYGPGVSVELLSALYPPTPGAIPA